MMSWSYIFIICFSVLCFGFIGYKIYYEVENSTIYPEINGTVIDVTDTFLSGRIAIIDLESGDRTREYCGNCIIGDHVTVKFFESGTPLSVTILEATP